MLDTVKQDERMHEYIFSEAGKRDECIPGLRYTELTRGGESVLKVTNLQVFVENCLYQ